MTAVPVLEGETSRVSPSGGGEDISFQELGLATRNHGMPLEALQCDLTPLGLHYVLVHFDIPFVDTTTWSLRVEGCVTTPLTMRLSDFPEVPTSTVVATMECAGNGRALMDPRARSQPWLHEAVGTAEWSGVPVHEILDRAGIAHSAVDVVFTGLDRGIDGGVDQFYARALSVDEARRPEVLLAYEMNGLALAPQHGAPLRLVVPGWYGMTNVKWLSSITIIDHRFRGYQHEHAYRLRSRSDDVGEPLSRMMPRALMVPPGTPDFFTRERYLASGSCIVRGRAWSGWSPIAAVEMSVDDGVSWHEAVLGPDSGQWAWRSWAFEWVPSAPGRHVLSCRARDHHGNDQSTRPNWNVGGYCNPAPQRVTVTVTA